MIRFHRCLRSYARHGNGLPAPLSVPDAPKRRPRFRDRTSLLFRMGLLNGVFAVGISFIVIAHHALQLQWAATDELVRLSDA